jgi:hypothetical protein
MRGARTAVYSRYYGVETDISTSCDASEEYHSGFRLWCQRRLETSVLLGQYCMGAWASALRGIYQLMTGKRS